MRRAHTSPILKTHRRVKSGCECWKNCHFQGKKRNKRVLCSVKYRGNSIRERYIYIYSAGMEAAVQKSSRYQTSLPRGPPWGFSVPDWFISQKQRHSGKGKPPRRRRVLRGTGALPGRGGTDRQRGKGSRASMFLRPHKSVLLHIIFYIILLQKLHSHLLISRLQNQL